MNKTISQITYNQHQAGNLHDGIDIYFCTAEVGKDGVIEINESEPEEGQGKHYCVINYKDGKSIKVFNLSTISYE